HFKEVNDEFGHQCGDHLLAAVSRRIRASLRPSDTLARLGGDEIGVLCPVLDTDGEAFRLAERLVRTIGQPFTIDERVLHTSVSIGVAFSDGTRLSAAGLVEQADRAMYRAKTAGRAQWATLTGPATAPPVASADVNEILSGVVQVRGRLDDLLGRLDVGGREWDRLAQASHALRRAAHLLEGNVRIG
ncbi:MAG TPA: GGDEF domain-containing protein, partial [Acidimicrobiales bacterium]|nr:GGDEF domain-containing protein [Acidimicrobiales bacterium]